VEEVMVIHEDVGGAEVVVEPREEVEDELVLTVVEQEEEDGEEEEDELVLTVVEQEVEEEEGEDVLEVVVDHAEPVSMIARTVASVENFIAVFSSFFD
jgi:hypothetical protein